MNPVQLRHELHRHPELSGRERETARRIAEFFRPLAPDRMIEGLGGAGLAFVFDGAAAGLGKAKTLSQNIAIGALIFHYPTFGLPAHEIGMTFLALATGLTLWSGYGYFADFFRGRE